MPGATPTIQGLALVVGLVVIYAAGMTAVILDAPRPPRRGVRRAARPPAHGQGAGGTPVFRPLAPPAAADRAPDVRRSQASGARHQRGRHRRIPGPVMQAATVAGLVLALTLTYGQQPAPTQSGVTSCRA